MWRCVVCGVECLPLFCLGAWGAHCSARMPTTRWPPDPPLCRPTSLPPFCCVLLLLQEKAASGRLFKGYFDKPEAAASAPLYEEQQPLFQAAAAGSQPAGVQEQQQRGRQRRRGGGMGLVAALQSVWAWLMRALRALLPFLF